MYFRLDKIGQEKGGGQENGSPPIILEPFWSTFQRTQHGWSHWQEKQHEMQPHRHRQAWWDGRAVAASRTYVVVQHPDLLSRAV